MSRTDGRKLVALAAAATTFALTFSTIYLPYMADRDKLRGLFEEGEDSIPEGARREIRQLQRAEAAELQRQQKQSEQQQQQQGDIQQPQRKGAGSMWSSFRRKQ